MGSWEQLQHDLLKEKDIFGRLFPRIRDTEQKSNTFSSYIFITTNASTRERKGN
jgi:hypothetical protein